MNLKMIMLGVLSLAVCSSILAGETESQSSYEQQIKALTDRLNLLNLQKSVEDAENSFKKSKNAAILSNIPTITPLDGSIAIQNYGLFGAVTALQTTNEIATQLCSEIKGKEGSENKFYIYDVNLANSINNATLVNEELYQLLQNINDEKSNKNNITSAVEPVGLIAEILLKVIAASRTNLDITKVDIPDPKHYLVKALEMQCINDSGPLIISTNIFDLRNEINEQDEIYTNFQTLIEDKVWLEQTLNGLEKKSKDYDRLSKLLARANVLIESLNGTGDKNLMNILKYRRISDAIKASKANILDIDIQQEGFTIKKGNAFTGQSLRVSSVTIVSYSLYDKDSKLIKSGIYRAIDKPVKINLRKADTEAIYGIKNIGEK